jgi:hypothetical protein
MNNPKAERALTPQETDESIIEQDTLNFFRSLPGDFLYTQWREEFKKWEGYDAFDVRNLHAILTTQQIAEYKRELACSQCKRIGGICNCHENPRTYTSRTLEEIRRFKD